MKRIYLLFVFLAFLILPAALATADEKGSRGKPVVVIDPGHGGADIGVMLTKDLHEKDLTLAIGKQVQEYLGSKGKIDVVMTREADRDASMEERVRSAVKSRADLFVCLHVNAGFAKDTSGFEVYFPGFKTPTKTSDDSGEIVKDMISTRSLNESVRFSQLLRRQMEIVFPRRDRGLRTSPVRILTRLAVPAVALEMGFATNERDKDDLTDAKRQREIAQAVGKSIEEYFGGGAP